MEALTIRIVKINNRPALIYQDFIFDIKNQDKVKRMLDIANFEVDLVKSNYGAPRSKRLHVIEADSKDQISINHTPMSLKLIYDG